MTSYHVLTSLMRDGENRQVKYIPRIDRKREVIDAQTLLLWKYILVLSRSELPRLVAPAISTNQTTRVLRNIALVFAHRYGRDKLSFFNNGFKYYIRV